MSTSSLSPEPEERPAQRAALGGLKSLGGGDGLPDPTRTRSPDDIVELANRASVDSLAALVASDGQLVRSRLLRGSHKFIVEVAKAPYEKEDRRRIWEIFKENMGASYKVSSFGWTPSAKKSELFHDDSRYILLRHATPAEVKQAQTKDESTQETKPAALVSDVGAAPSSAAAAGVVPAHSFASSTTAAAPADVVSAVPEPTSVVAHVASEDDDERKVADLLGQPTSSSPAELVRAPVVPAPAPTTTPLPATILPNPPTHLPLVASSSFTSTAGMLSSPAGRISTMKYPFSLLSSTPPPPPSVATVAAPAATPNPVKGKAKKVEVGERRRSARIQSSPAAAPATTTTAGLPSPLAAGPPVLPGATSAALRATPGSASRFRSIAPHPILQPLPAPMTPTAAGPAAPSSAAKSPRSSARRSVTVGVDYREHDGRTGRAIGEAVPVEAGPSRAALATPNSTPTAASAKTAFVPASASPAESSPAPYDPFAKRTKRGRPRKESVERRVAAEAELEAEAARARTQRQEQRRLEREARAKEDEAREREQKELEGLAVEGYLMWRFDTEPNESGDMEPIVYLYELSVSKEFQRAGLGRYLVSRLESLGRAWGCRKVILTVLKSNVKAMDFYRKMGYEIDHSSPSRFTWSDSDESSAEDDTPAVPDIVPGLPPPPPVAVSLLDDDHASTSVSPSSPPPPSLPATTPRAKGSSDEPPLTDAGDGEVSGMLWIGGTWRRVKYDYEIMSKVLVDEPVVDLAAVATAAAAASGPTTPAAVRTHGTPARSSAVKERRGRSRRRATMTDEAAPQMREPTAIIVKAADSAAAPPAPLPAHAINGFSFPGPALDSAATAGANGNKKKRKRLVVSGLVASSPGAGEEDSAARQGPRSRQ